MSQAAEGEGSGGHLFATIKLLPPSGLEGAVRPTQGRGTSRPFFPCQVFFPLSSCAGGLG
jgi:hypothetical protein